MDVVEESRTRITLKEYGVLNASASDYPGNSGFDDTWSYSKFKKRFRVKVVKLNNTDMEFDIIGVHAALANAFRRILLSEVPSMAIEKVFIYNNTSLIQDEVLAHRLGLIPLKADARLFEYRSNDDSEPSEQDTLQYELKIKCTWGIKDSPSPLEKYKNSNVYSKHIKWISIGNQEDVHSAASVGPVHDDILIDKMRPGQELDLKLQAVKGIGRDHAKFSPVATAYYRLLPEITLMKSVKGEMAEQLQKCFSPGVIKLVDTPHGKKKAVVADARYDMCSRNVFKYDDLKDAVKMNRVRDHFIFTIESVGALPPDVLFIEAVRVLRNKCKTFIDILNQEK